MQRIVAATDFSARSRLALRRAGLLARKSGAELTIVHMVDDDQPERLIELERSEAQRILVEEIDAIAELRGIRCHLQVGIGDAFVGILHAAETIAADLIVMGRHRKKLLRDVFIGTTVERVIRTGTRPVLMVSTQVQHAYARVLAAVDMSEASARALETGRALGLLDDVDITFVHAFAALARGKMFADVAQERIEEHLGEERLRANAELIAFLQKSGFGNGRGSRRVEEGAPFEVISRVVNETESDLLVLGAHGRSTMARILLGSVTEEALRTLEIDTLAVPPVRPQPVS
jgi:nucleotide-binding universal stress UspA family protein